MIEAISPPPIVYRVARRGTEPFGPPPRWIGDDISRRQPYPN